MAVSVKKRRNMYLFSAILLFAFLFTYYFLGYIPSRERQMNERGTRILTQISDASADKLEHYRKSAEIFSCNYFVGNALDSLIQKDTTAYNTISAVFDLKMDNSCKESIIDSIYAKYYRLADGSEDVTYGLYRKLLNQLLASLQTDPSLKVEPLNSDTNPFVLLKSDSSTKAIVISPEKLLGSLKRLDFYDDIILTETKTGNILNKSELSLRLFKYKPPTEKEIEISDKEIQKLVEDIKEERIANDTIHYIPNVDIVLHKIGGKNYFAFTTLVRLNGKDYYLTGLLDEDRYYTSVRQVSIWTILISILALLFLVQILPIIKPFLLSKKERLQGVDITWSAVSLVFGTAVITLMVIGIDTFAIEEIELVDQKLRTHARNADADFQEELDYTINEILAARRIRGDSAKPEDLALFDDVIHRKTRFLDIGEDGQAFYYTINPETKAIVVLDKRVNLSHRNYVKALKGSATGAWKRTGTNKLYFVESILSLSLGTYETVVAIKDTATGRMEAAVCQFASVNHRYLEPGYTYSIIGKDGEIHYDTDSTRTHTENFIAETDFDPEFQSLLTNRVSHSGPLNVSLKDYRVYLHPLSNTPWFVVIKYDIRKSRLNVAQSMLITFEVVLFILLYLFMLHWLHKLPNVLSNRGSLKDFSYLFLSPVNATPRLYWMLCGFNVLSATLLIITYRNNDLTLALNIFIFLSVITQAILLNYSFLKRYSYAYVTGEVRQYLGLNAFEWSLVMFWVLWMILAFYTLPEGVWYMVLQTIQVVLMIIYVWAKLKNPFINYFSTTSIAHKSAKNSFYVHTFTWVSMLGVISCFLFFKPIYNQIHIKRATANWIEEYDYRNDHHLVIDHKVNLFEADTNSWIPEEDINNTSNFIDRIALYFDEDASVLYGQRDSAIAIEMKLYEAYDTGQGLPFFILKLNKNTHRVGRVPIHNNTIVAFALPSLDHGTKPTETVVFWVIISVLVFGLFISIVQLTQKFFYLNIINRLRTFSQAILLKQNVEQDLEKALPDDSIKDIFLIGPPGSGRNSVARTWFKPDASIYYIDFLNDLDSESSKLDQNSDSGLDIKAMPIIINNFDYRSQDFDLNLKKLNIIEKLVRYRNEKQVKERMVVIANFGTDQLIQMYLDRIADLRDAKDPDNEIKGLYEAIDRWQSIFFGFVNNIMALQHTPSSDFLGQELNIGTTLPRLLPQMEIYRSQLNKNAKELSEAEKQQKLVNAIIEMAQNYYFAIWNACTPSEKLLLFDLAEDGLVNTKNESLMSDMVQKGLLRTEPTLGLFNRSFTQFVLQNIPEEEGAHLEKRAKGEGMWGTYQIIIVLMIFSIIVFLSFAEKEVMAKIAGAFAFAATLLPKLLEFTSKLGNPKAWFTKGG